MHRARRTLLLAVLSTGLVAATASLLPNVALPIIIVPEEVQEGTSLIGSAYSPEGGVSVTVRIGTEVLWTSGDPVKDTTEVDFSVRIPRGSTGAVTVDAEDQRGNSNSARVTITR